MSKLYKCTLLAFAAFMMAAALPSFAEDAPKAPAKSETKIPEIVDNGWEKRCNEKAKTECEVFERLQVKSSGARVAEFAVGFPKNDNIKAGDARGVVVLPLGILLEPGVGMKIDENKPMTFKSRYCTNGGCFSFVNLSADILDSLRKGKTVSFFFKSMDGQSVRLVMNLKGFDSALKNIQ